MPQFDIEKKQSAILRYLGEELKIRLSGEPKNRQKYTAEEFVMEIMTRVDPSPNKKYTYRILLLFIKGVIDASEDVFKLAYVAYTGSNEEEFTYLELFDRYKSNLPENKRNIDSYSNYNDLLDAAQSLGGTQTRSEVKGEDHEKFHSIDQAIIWLDNETYKVVSPLTMEAALYFGKNTRWCTSAKVDNAFESYHSVLNPLYIILHKPTNDRWQFHWSSPQFKTADHRDVNLYEFFKQHPTILEVPEFNDFFEFTDYGYLLRVPSDSENDGLTREEMEAMMMNEPENLEDEDGDYEDEEDYKTKRLKKGR